MKGKLLMTLLVRDEEEILEKNICHHLNHGVDMIIATDNGSIDGTVDILDKYQKKGVLEYLSEKEQNYEQDKWVSRMAAMAVEKNNASFVVHCDADEFWYSATGNLKDGIDEFCDVVYVNVINYLPPRSLSTLFFNFDNFSFLVSKTVSCPVPYDDRISSNLLLYAYPKKIITSRKVLNIAYGNDTPIYDGELKKSESDLLHIHHFPIRSLKHFERKVINGGTSFLKNPLNNRDICWHWKQWYQLYKDGKIIDEYKKIALFDRELLDRLLNNEIVKECRVPRKIHYSESMWKLRNWLR